MRKAINPKAWMCPNPVLIIACYKENDDVSIVNYQSPKGNWLVTIQ